jgi:iron-sulfur cluster repair protein YtfE (RIC family)
MQAAPAKATELFARLSETSNNALKTRERLFAELKSERELHADLEEQHLFPLLRKHAETRELVANAIKYNRDVRTRLEGLESLPKNHEDCPPPGERNAAERYQAPSLFTRLERGK